MRCVVCYLVAALGVGGCGRIGYDPFASDGGNRDDGDAQGIDASNGDGSADASMCIMTSEGPAGDPSCADGEDNDCDLLFDEIDPDCASPSCFTVTTATDENDGGETAMPPHQGAGLSLREAITIANTVDGEDCIVFNGSMTISVAAGLPQISGIGGLTINGGQEVTIERMGETSNIGLDLVSDNNAILGIHIRDYAGGTGIGIRVAANENTVGPGVEVESCGNGVRVTGDRNTVTGSRLHDNENHGVQLSTGTADTVIMLSLLHDNQDGGIQMRAAAGLTFQHNTVFGNLIGFDAKDASTGLVLNNNLFVGNASIGVDGLAGTFTSLDFNGYFNTGTACLGCTIGANSITSDPMFGNPSMADFSLTTGSEAIDGGTDTGLDVNGSASGLFNGAAPDLGAIESP